jgi:hypothetical protein
MTITDRLYRRFVFVILSLATSAASAAAGIPLSPYKALSLPKVINLTLRTAPVQAITTGSLTIQLEVTPLDAVKQQFGGVIRNAGDAGDAVTWLCYAGEYVGQMHVVYWFASDDEMSGGHHEVTQTAVQANPSGKVPEGCSSAPSTLTDIHFGVPSVGSSLGAVVKHFGKWKPDSKGYLSYGPDMQLGELNDALQKMNWRSGGSGLGSHRPAT